MNVTIRSAVDPKDVRINQRYRDVRKLPPLIANAIKQITKDAQLAGQAAGVTIPKDRRVRLRVSVWYTFNDMRADIDGPNKRVLDAIAAGLEFNDNRVDEFHQYRTEVGTPGIVAEVETLGEVEGDTIEALVDDPWALIPGETYAMIRS